MKILFGKDETLNLDLEQFSSWLNELSQGVRFGNYQHDILIEDAVISNPESYDSLIKLNHFSLNVDDCVFVLTKKPYDNNYFYDSDHKSITIYSFSDWEMLTSLSIQNGLVYFICQFLSDSLLNNLSHEEETGCLNDFLWDKKAIDIGMKTAFLCPKCKSVFDLRKKSKREKEIFGTLEKLLDQLCIASRNGSGFLDYWTKGEAVKDSFDVFLCHNSEDKEAIRALNAQLKEVGVKTWLDEEQLRPGTPWQVELESQIQSIKTVVVAVGSSGVGPWQNVEFHAFLLEFVHRKCPVIPLLLSDCSDIPSLPIFLKSFTWVDFRREKPDPFKHLLWGITGRR